MPDRRRSRPEKASGTRQNSYHKPEPQAQDIQVGGHAGDVGNGPDTGHKTSPSATATESQANDASAANQQKQRAKGTKRQADTNPPEAAGESPGPYSGT